MNKTIETWIKNVKTYPPAEIFFEKYGKEAKSEKRIQDLCEEVYRFCFPEGEKNPLSDLSQSYRELEVAYILGFEGMKKEYLQKVKDKFLEDAKYAIKALDNLFKKDQLLQKYYVDWKLKYSELETEVYKMTKGVFAMKVIITAEARVHLSKIVEMSEEDYEKYKEIVVDSTGLTYREIDQEIAKLADKYDFGYGDDIEDMEDPEEVTFQVFKEGSN